jgi:hypothetical protein
MTSRPRRKMGISEATFYNRCGGPLNAVNLRLM